MLLLNSCVCDWCEHRTVIDVEEEKNFWKRVRNELCPFCGLSSSARHIQQNECNLFNVKNYTWLLGEETFTFIIGLNPLRSFRVEILLEKKGTRECLKLDNVILTELFVAIRKLYELNVYYPVLNRGMNRERVHIANVTHGVYSLSIRNRSMYLSDKNLIALLDLQPFVVEILQIYEFERVKAESSLFRLLELMSRKTKPLVSDLIELITAPCSYVPVGFIIEIGTQHFELLLRLLAVYQVTRKTNKEATCHMNDIE